MHKQIGKRKIIYRGLPEERPKPSEKAGFCLNSVSKSALLYITVSNVLLNAKRALSYLHGMMGFLLRQ